jgi:hypothetical protein
MGGWKLDPLVAVLGSQAGLPEITESFWETG